MWINTRSFMRLILFKTFAVLADIICFNFIGFIDFYRLSKILEKGLERRSKRGKLLPILLILTDKIQEPRE